MAIPTSSEVYMGLWQSLAGIDGNTKQKQGIQRKFIIFPRELINQRICLSRRSVAHRIINNSIGILIIQRLQ